ncbi:MAG: GNAT family N-acetyltransferase [Akkermansiaceae bacterium]
MQIRSMRDDERDSVAQLIHQSTNSWYEHNRGHVIFDPSEPLACKLFTDVYEDLDPGCCLVAVSDDDRIMGSCFYHPRETHVSLGIMNTHPEAAGLGVARKLLSEIITRAEDKPARLVSSAMNLDSYSLYTKAGFVPQSLFQDMQFPAGMDLANLPHQEGMIRPATIDDAPVIADLEMRLCGIRREKDYRYFIGNQRKIWRCLVIEKDGQITGFLNAVNHPASCMLGPGVFHCWQDALALICAQHRADTDARPVFLVPTNEKYLVAALYHLGARNLELHVSQILGDPPEPMGVTMPTFMPETG